MVSLSLLSTLPSLSPLSLSSPAISTTTTRYSPLPGTIRCSSNNLEVDDDRFRRRDFLNCLALSAGIEVISSSGTFSGDAYAADLIQRRQRSEFQSDVKGTLYTAIKKNPDLIPSILTLALNDVMTYDKASKSGGPNGSIRFSSEISRPENKGLSSALNLLEDAKKEIDSYSKGGPIAYADLIQCAAQSALKNTFLASAIRKCGGNEEKGSLLYTAYGSNGQWGLFDKTFGRTDAQEPDPEGRVPQWDKASVQEMKDKFKAVGFGPRQLAVMSAFLGPDQKATEDLLATDPEVAPWVQKYQRSRETVSQTDYEVSERSSTQSALKNTFLASAIRKCGGNEEKGSLLYTAYGSNGQWGLFDKTFGRTDAQEPDPEGRVPQWDKASVQEMKDKFKAVGFGPRQLAVMSAFLGPDQKATEDLLATDPEVAPWVQKYQRSRETVSQTDYEVDLITTLTKLSCLGQQINYEAYTYPVKKIELSKLKL